MAFLSIGNKFNGPGRPLHSYFNGFHPKYASALVCHAKCS